MTDITFKVIKDPQQRAGPSVIGAIKDACELVIPNQYLTVVTKLNDLSAIYTKLQSSLPSEHFHDRDAMYPLLRQFLAYCNFEIEKLKLADPKSKLLPSIIRSLYLRISSITNIVTRIQKLRQNATKILFDIEKSRSETQTNLPPSISFAPDHEDFADQNRQLLASLNKENDLIEKTKETAHQLSQLLQVFQQKVSEQECMSLNILKDAENSLGYMKTAKQHLNSANEQSKGLEKIWVFFFLSMTFAMVFYDWWTSRTVYTADS